MKHDLPPISPQWIEKLERAAAQGRRQRKDWERNFQHRMSFESYRLRGRLQREVALGHMAVDQAILIIRAFEARERINKAQEDSGPTQP